MSWRTIAVRVLVPVLTAVAAALADVGLLHGELYQAVVGLLHLAQTLFGS